MQVNPAANFANGNQSCFLPLILDCLRIKTKPSIIFGGGEAIPDLFDGCWLLRTPKRVVLALLALSFSVRGAQFYPPLICDPQYKQHRHKVHIALGCIDFHSLTD